MFRDVNERLEALAANRGRSQIEIVCECASTDCSAPLQRSIAGYESARREPTNPLLECRLQYLAERESLNRGGLFFRVHASRCARAEPTKTTAADSRTATTP